MASYSYLADALSALTVVVRGEVERSIFPDGEHYLRVLTDVDDHDVVLIGGTTSDAATLELYDLACALVENGAATLTLIVPWFGYSTMERAVHPGEAVVAKNRARLFSSIPAAKLGNQIVMLDLHSEGLPHYFEGAIHPVHIYGRAVIEPLARELGGERFVLGSTDAGRAKWVESLANDLDVPAAFVYKRRLGPEHTEVTAVSRRFDGETVVIYDDMIRTGSSLMNAARAYLQAGAGRIAAVATHGVFPGDALQRIAASGLFFAIACTDSHSNAQRVRSELLIVRSAAPLFVPFVKQRA
ncbi:MAG: ribose-phosphate diphosphokinase [Acidobacteriota bacterium]